VAVVGRSCSRDLDQVQVLTVVGDDLPGEQRGNHLEGLGQALDACGGVGAG